MARINESFGFFSIVDGCSLTNQDTSDTSTQYYGYTRPGGSWVIMRIQNADGTNSSYDFLIGADVPAPFGNSDLSGYDTAWTNRASTTYRRVGELKAL